MALCAVDLSFRGGLFDFSGGLPIQTLFAKVPIYGRYGKISGGADNGKISRIELPSIT